MFVSEFFWSVFSRIRTEYTFHAVRVVRNMGMIDKLGKIIEMEDLTFKKIKKLVSKHGLFFSSCD